MNLESPKVNVAKSAEYVFNALNDMKNFEKLMPENIAKFEVIDENCFEFGLKGMPEIKLVKKGQTAPEAEALPPERKTNSYHQLPKEHHKSERPCQRAHSAAQ